MNCDGMVMTHLRPAESIRIAALAFNCALEKLGLVDRNDPVCDL